VAWFRVSIDFRGDNPFELTVDELGDRLGDLVNELMRYSGVGIGGGAHAQCGITMSLESATTLTAIADAAAIIRRACSDVFLPNWSIVRVEAVRQDVLDEELARCRRHRGAAWSGRRCRKERPCPGPVRHDLGQRRVDERLDLLLEGDIAFAL
jgi:hypothetical protein